MGASRSPLSHLGLFPTESYQANDKRRNENVFPCHRQHFGSSGTRGVDIFVNSLLGSLMTLEFIFLFSKRNASGVRFPLENQVSWMALCHLDMI